MADRRSWRQGVRSEGMGSEGSTREETEDVVRQQLGGERARGGAAAPAYKSTGVYDATAPCFSCEYFLRTACSFAPPAALWSLLISRTHGISAASE